MKIRILIILCFIGLSISSCQSLITDSLSISDIEKYSDDIKIRYATYTHYGNKSYILNMYNNSILDTTYEKNNQNTNEEFNGYRVAKIKGIKAIYDNDNNVILDLDIVARKFGYNSYECRLLKYDKTGELLYMFLIDSYTNALLIVYQMDTGQVDEIMKTGSKYNNKIVSYSYILNNNIVYILNDKDELCWYDFDTKELKNSFIKPLCYSISDNKIIYNDSEFVYEYDKKSATIKKLFRTKGHIEELNINKDGTFLLTIETLFWHTEIFDDFLQWPTHNMNCLKIYEVSTGKSKVLVNGNKKFYVTSASFLEQTEE